MLEHVLGPDANAFDLARTGGVVADEVAAQVEALVERRLAGEPLQYVLGRWSFRSLELVVDRRVLIPRPETELVAGYALDELAAVASTRAADDELVAVDLGTGSGAIALALATEGPTRIGGRRLVVHGADVSSDALEVAGANRASVLGARPEAAPVHLAQGSWFEALAPDLRGQVALVVANPPYVSESEWEDLEPVVRDYEPRGALVAGAEGTEAVGQVLADAPHWLVPDGVLVLEVAPHQADDIAMRALLSGFDGVIVRADLAKRPRVVIARRWGGP